MSLSKQIIAVLLLTAQSLVWAAPENPHAPKAVTTGTVVATENADRYTYVQIDIGGEKIWFAAPASTFSIGEEVVIPSGGLPMKDFYSKTLDRTFDMVYFTGNLKRINTSGETLPPGHPPIHAAESPKPAETDLSDIQQPEGGKTIAEIYQQQDALAGKPVIVRGKAVKVSNGILGKNWIHLQDGSGEEGSDDLTVTMDGLVKPGDIITVRGTLNLDRDFGSGYKYGVILEDATLQTE